MLNNKNLEAVIEPASIVHGGDWNIPDSLREDHLEGVLKAVEIGYRILKKGRSSLDAVEKAVTYMEDNPTFDAGIGSFLNEEGEVELDALIMDGSNLRSGSVGAVKVCQNPVSLARLLLENTSTMMVVGRGADLLAEKMGISCDPKILIIDRERERWRKGKEDIFTPISKGTVGAVALDSNGSLASATSTGGSQYKIVGRLGDTPLIGNGGYANEFAATSLTGHGESLMKIVAAKMATDLVERNFLPSIAAKKVIDKIANINGYGGIIIIDRFGNIGTCFNTKRMAYAYFTKEGELFSGIDE
jgi:beta-aspartyl-peptidase (threonine type)